MLDGVADGLLRNALEMDRSVHVIDQEWLGAFEPARNIEKIAGAGCEIRERCCQPVVRQLHGVQSPRQIARKENPFFYQLDDSEGIVRLFGIGLEAFCENLARKRRAGQMLT